VDTSGTPVLNDFARFTDADTIEGRSYAEVRADLSLEVGTDVQAYSANLDTYAANPLTAGELGQLQAIGATTISSAQWGYLGATTAFAGTLLDDADAAAARTTLGVDAAGTDNSTDVTLAGTPDYITISGQVITRNLIDLTTDVTGDLPVAEGGTGASTAAGARTNLGLVIGTDVQAFDADILKADTADQLTAGFSATTDNDGAQSSGTYTPDEATGNYKRIENTGAFTLAPPATASGESISVVVLVENGTGAGAITTSGFTQVTGDSFTTTTTDDFMCFIDVVNVGGTAFSTLNVVALQ